MKIVSAYALIAETVLRDESRKVSIINIFEKVYAPSVPTIQARLFLLIGLTFDNIKLKNDLQLTLKVTSPSGKLLIELDIPLNFDTYDSNEGQVAADLSMMPIEAYGEYRFTLYNKEAVVITKVLVAQKPEESTS